MIKNFAMPDFLQNIDAQITVTEKKDRSVCYCEKTQRVTDEKYIFKVSADKKIEIECSGEKSLFYALIDIKSRIDNGTLAEGEYICAPSFKVRGYIEGFYGIPWSHEKRKSVMLLMAKNRMNTVYYAPKDDDYHRELWRDLYSGEDLARLKELVDLAKEYYMDFYWCIAPGLSMEYSSDAEFETLIEKTKQLYSIGVRNFGLLLDDIEEELAFESDKAMYGETVNAHIALIEKYHSTLLEMDSANRLTVCPTLYNGKGDEYYISKLGQNISPLISLFWTGKDICSRELCSSDAIKFIEGTHHKPLYWDNYPVNDMAMFNEMHISPIINRDADLWKYSEGIISNCMEYAECSKIPLITFADYLWDSEGYNPDESWMNAIAQVVGKEDAEKFAVFADHLYVSCLKDEPSRRMKKHFAEVLRLLKTDEREKAIALAEEYIAKMKETSDYLRQDLPICNELTKWSEKFFVACEIFEKLIATLKNKTEENVNALYEVIDRFNSMPVKLSEEMNMKLFLGIMYGI